MEELPMKLTRLPFSKAAMKQKETLTRLFKIKDFNPPKPAANLCQSLPVRIQYLFRLPASSACL